MLVSSSIGGFGPSQTLGDPFPRGPQGLVPSTSGIISPALVDAFRLLRACSVSPRTKNFLRRILYSAFDEAEGADQSEDRAAILCAICTCCAGFVRMSFGLSRCGSSVISAYLLRARPKAERVLLRIRENPEYERLAGRPAVVMLLRGLYLWNRKPD